MDYEETEPSSDSTTLLGSYRYHAGRMSRGWLSYSTVWAVRLLLVQAFLAVIYASVEFANSKAESIQENTARERRQMRFAIIFGIIILFILHTIFVALYIRALLLTQHSSMLAGGIIEVVLSVLALLVAAGALQVIIVDDRYGRFVWRVVAGVVACALTAVIAFFGFRVRNVVRRIRMRQQRSAAIERSNRRASHRGSRRGSTSRDSSRRGSTKGGSGTAAAGAAGASAKPKSSRRRAPVVEGKGAAPMPDDAATARARYNSNSNSSSDVSDSDLDSAIASALRSSS